MLRFGFIIHIGKRQKQSMCNFTYEQCLATAFLPVSFVGIDAKRQQHFFSVMHKTLLWWGTQGTSIEIRQLHITQFVNAVIKCCLASYHTKKEWAVTSKAVYEALRSPPSPAPTSCFFLSKNRGENLSLQNPCEKLGAATWAVVLAGKVFGGRPIFHIDVGSTSHNNGGESH